MLRRFARNLTRSPETADELVQEACERALSNEDPGGIGRLDLWMKRLILSLWNDRRRELRRRGRIEQVDALRDVAGSDGRLDAEARLTLAEVRRALRGLPPEQRTVMILVCVDGLSYREAADQLGIPVGTVMSRLARGRLALIKRMKRRPTPAPGRAPK
nr:RNA polymerase sigma factor [Indioceanicola profundi]